MTDQVPFETSPSRADNRLTRDDDTVHDTALETGDDTASSAVKWKWPLAGGLVLLAAMILTIVVNTLPTTYAAQSVVAVRSKANSAVPADEQMLLAGEYAVFLSSEGNLTPATRAYPDFDASAATVTVDPNTATLRILVKTGHRQESVNIANAMSALAIQRGRSDDRVQIVSLANATADGVQIGPKRSLYLLSGFVLILAIAAAILYLRKRSS